MFRVILAHLCTCKVRSYTSLLSVSLSVCDLIKIQTRPKIQTSQQLVSLEVCYTLLQKKLKFFQSCISFGEHCIRQNLKFKTLCHSQWPRGTRGNGQIKLKFLLEKSVVSNTLFWGFALLPPPRMVNGRPLTSYTD